MYDTVLEYAEEGYEQFQNALRRNLPFCKSTIAEREIATTEFYRILDESTEVEFYAAEAPDQTTNGSEAVDAFAELEDDLGGTIQVEYVAGWPFEIEYVARTVDGDEVVSGRRNWAEQDA